MTSWRDDYERLIKPAVARSAVTDAVLIDHGAVAATGAMTARHAQASRALVMADEAGFGAAGPATIASLKAAGIEVETLILPVDPLPVASVEEAEPFRAALAADPDLFPISVGSGVINDLVKYAAFQTGRRYIAVATAASMDGYTSAGAPLVRRGFKVTIQTQAPIVLIADLDVLANAPAEMTGWGYADLAGKSPAGGDWILADLAGAEPLCDSTFPLVQDHLDDWLAGPEGIATGDADSAARLFVGLTAVGFAMEFHGSSRPASGADHQIAHIWEMEGLKYHGRKVSHGAAVAIGCLTTLALFDWLLEQDLSRLDRSTVLNASPNLETRLAVVDAAFSDPEIATRARIEVTEKHVDRAGHAGRLNRIIEGWPDTRDRLRRHLYRYEDMAEMLRRAGAPTAPAEIGVDDAHLVRTVWAAPFLRRRYTICDLLHETGLWHRALTAVLPRLSSIRGAAE